MDKGPEQQQAKLKELLSRTKRILTQKQKDKKQAACAICTGGGAHQQDQRQDAL
jgi:hypothetical protein